MDHQSPNKFSRRREKNFEAILSSSHQKSKQVEPQDGFKTTRPATRQRPASSRLRGSHLGTPMPVNLLTATLSCVLSSVAAILVVVAFLFFRLELLDLLELRLAAWLDVFSFSFPCFFFLLSSLSSYISCYMASSGTVLMHPPLVACRNSSIPIIIALQPPPFLLRGNHLKHLLLLQFCCFAMQEQATRSYDACF